MSTRGYSCLQAIPLSFFSGDLYRDVARHWRWTTFFYLCLIVTICSIPAAIKIQRNTHYFATQFVNEYVAQSPPIMITEGVARTPEKRPYLIHDPDTREVIAMIDTTGAHQSLENEKFDLLITSKSIMRMNRADGTLTVKQFPDTLTMTFDPEVVKKKAHHWLNWSWLILFPIVMLISIVYRFLLAMVYAILGKILAIFSEVDLMYEVVVRITMVALTPTIILNALFNVFAIHFPLQNFLLFIIGIAYVFFAVIANEKD